MFIQTERTPNPASLKFLPGKAVLPGGGRDFADVGAAGPSPLARRLFAIDGVTGIYLGADFITVSKAEAEDWQVIKPLVLGAIMEHFTSGEPVLIAGTAAESAGSAEDDEVVRQIRDLLETRVRPAVAQDGGDIVFDRFQDGVVYLHLRGSCSGCPSSTATLKHGIENMLRHYIPEVEAVEAVL
ncbi:NifU family protein [Rhodospirillum rubrum]|uniref:Nitrogen-fixing NifU-like n=1 Tax=Rhodospirillum rubrum (strain ATCC 11170 / ATH 1.1.1 / DSM 467 / LMG 4362 / NCIMB 8255 / S1) TaxID=269796 RepID=Q2RNH0_RHORT|nr:NifU family protein [Rhodospirillum rubrum]ABC24325.1 Nitrogen-fixing NifU-like [Rhodospirillum rubrum ATCC 11170]AEO50076.1 nitrogen-fixing NifU-like protein [Rhodospirillum rubrum F11]MBK5956043.1 NifU family protein [Rhodospirillum rubrum]QXG80252.1 NifU family protein [Rhodospirillum rubrum]HCF19024.1 NifU family protein [Rhodospirillum rubrum]